MPRDSCNLALKHCISKNGLKHTETLSHNQNGYSDDPNNALNPTLLQTKY